MVKISGMKRAELANRYCKLEAELAQIADTLGYGVKDLTANYNRQPDRIKDKLRPILLEQLELLQEMRRNYCKDLGNVLSFPIAGLQRR